MMDKGEAYLAELNPRKLYLDFSASDVVLQESFYLASVSLYENGSLVAGNSFRLVKSGARLYLLDPVGFKNWLLENENADEVQLVVNGLEFSLVPGVYQTTMLLVYDGQLVAGASNSFFNNNCKNCIQY